MTRTKALVNNLLMRNLQWKSNLDFCVKPWLQRRKNLEFYETLLAELWLKDEYSYNILLRITSVNFEEIFQLTKDDLTKENTKMRELIPPRLQFAATIGFLSRGIIQELCLWVLFSLLNYEQFNIYFFSHFLLFHFFFYNHLSDFFTFHKNSL